MAINWNRLKPYWKDRALQALFFSWVAVSVLGYVLWIQPQHTVQAQQAKQFSTLTQQHTELNNSVGLAEGALADYPTRLALAGSPWQQSSYHRQTLLERIANEQRPDYGALYQLDIQPRDVSTSPFRYADVFAYTLTARGSYQSLAAIVQQWVTQRPFLQINSVVIKPMVRQKNTYLLTLGYFMPVLRSSELEE
jgi:hypothetical protein